MKAVDQLMQGDRFARHCGIDLVSCAPGRAVARLAIEPRHLNAIGIVQGGAIFTLADFAFAAASNSHGPVAVGIHVSITYMKAVSAGVLTAEAVEVALNPKLATYDVKVTDEAGALAASFQGLVYRKTETGRRGGTPGASVT